MKSALIPILLCAFGGLSFLGCLTALIQGYYSWALGFASFTAVCGLALIWDHGNYRRSTRHEFDPFDVDRFD